MKNASKNSGSMAIESISASQTKILSRLKPQDKQSTRTTFKLSKESSDNIRKWAREDRITIKEFFEILSKMCEILEVGEPGSSDQISFVLQEEDRDLTPFIRKTYVISKRSFDLFSAASKKHHVSRNLIIEALVRLYAYLKRSRVHNLEESKKNHPKAYEIIKKLSRQADETEENLQKILAENDPIFERFRILQYRIEDLLSDINEELKGGRPVAFDDYA